MKKIIWVMVLLLCSGCIQGDVEDANDKLAEIERLYSIDLELMSRTYYATGLRDGFMLKGETQDEAIEHSEALADLYFGIEED